jgi:hypothetical protein
MIDPARIMVSGHTFRAVSPKGKSIIGVTSFAVLPTGVSPSFRFNAELTDHVVLSQAKALDLLAEEGMAEAKEGLSLLINE